MIGEPQTCALQVAPDTQYRIKELLRKSLLGSEIVHTQFYLFSTKSVSSDGSRVTRPRVLCANNVLLINSSKYFFNLLKSKTSLDTSLIEIMGDQEIPSETRIDDYGYESDSDLEDDCPLEVPSIPAPPPSDPHMELEDSVETPGNRPDSVASDIFILNPEEDQKSDESEGEPSTSKITAQHDAIFVQTTLLRSQNARRIFIKDTAFQTWYALLYYLYTGEVTFLPLKSARRTQRTLSDPLDPPKCSAKSMYRLASKVGLEPLCNKALEFLRDNITEHNVLKELVSSLLHRYLPLLEMVLDVLYANIASEPVVTRFSALAKRIARNEVPHGAGIVAGLHLRLLKKHHPDALPSIESPVKNGVKKGKVRRANFW